MIIDDFSSFLRVVNFEVLYLCEFLMKIHENVHTFWGNQDFSSNFLWKTFGFFPMIAMNHDVEEKPLMTLPFIYLRTVPAKNFIFGDLEGLLHSVFI